MKAERLSDCNHAQLNRLFVEFENSGRCSFLDIRFEYILEDFFVRKVNKNEARRIKTIVWESLDRDNKIKFLKTYHAEKLENKGFF